MDNNLIGDELELINIKKKISSGVVVLLVREFFLKIFAFAGQIILARILFPSDFGTIAIIAFVINFVALFVDIGLSSAIIREKKKPTEKQLSTIFYIKLLLTILAIGILFISASLIGKFINGFDTENFWMIRVYALSLIFIAVKSVPIALIERNLKFNLVSLIDIGGVVAYQISVIIFAVTGFGVWSFIYAIFIKEIIEVIIIYKTCPWRPKNVFNLKKINEMIHFGLYMQGGGFLNFIQTSVIPFLGGIMTNTYQVGLLDWAFGNALIPETITNNFGRVAFSAFGKMQKNREIIADTIYKSIKFLSIINLFFVIIILGFGREIIEILYTSKWLTGIGALYWFTASMIFTPFISIYAQGIFALGKSKIYFKYNLFCVIIEWFFAYLLILKFGFVGIAISFFILCASLAFSSYLIAHKEKIAKGLVSLILPIFVMLIISLITADLLNQLIEFSILGLILKLIIMSFVYLMLIIIFANEFTTTAFRIIKQNYLNLNE